MNKELFLNWAMEKGFNLPHTNLLNIALEEEVELFDNTSVNGVPISSTLSTDLSYHYLARSVYGKFQGLLNIAKSGGSLSLQIRGYRVVLTQQDSMCESQLYQLASLYEGELPLY